MCAASPPVKPSLRAFSLALCLAFAFLFPRATWAQDRPSRHAVNLPSRDTLPSGAEKELFEATNRERADEDLPPLKWDPALAEAARKHALRMAQEKLLEHQYGGEESLR